jgi:ankyrin repeat protein
MVTLVRQDGATPLFIASWNVRVEVVRALLAKGADVEAKSNVRAS